MKPIKRFTLFTSNCNTKISAGTRAYEFRFNLNGGYLECDGDLRIAIESINVRDTVNIIPTLDYTAESATTNGTNAGVQNQVALGNTDEKELYTIRSPNISSSETYDNIGGAPIIYQGSLNFQNMNPTQCFNYQCDKSILNTEFSLIIDDNYRDVPGNGALQKGIKNSVNVAITFLIYKDENNKYVS